ncbi:hypothetical protein PVIIG_00831 [Plasmodium vivax India VII]|uniref:Kazal-like domain-containing protein n=1 Tax=Plasmodium vivax India VII TaxID=1077284 RepID=A0A0J9SCB1_PLAVI|nr:hypothetical protein PVIIG_00831 [Plasmodium vivax India VII]
MQFLPICEDNFDKITAQHGRQYNNECSFICSRINDSNLKFFVPCQKLTMYLKELKDKHTKTDVSEDCKYLNYRINDELLKYMKDQTLDEIYTELINAYNDQKYNLNTICVGIMKPINKDIFEKVKRVFKIYNTFNKILRGHSTSNNPNCNYINEAINLYMSYKGKCNGQPNQSFCKALENFRYYYQASIGNINDKCKVENYTLESFQEHDSGPHEMAGLESALDEVEVDETGSSTNYNTKKNMLTSFYIILPITFFSFILYKVNKYFIYIYEYSPINHDTNL